MSLLRDQQIRSILWMFSTSGPVVAIALVTLCCWRPTRRPAIVTVSFSGVAAALVTIWFHYAYVTPIWQGHSSAIWLLDRAAFRAAFAITACVIGIALLVYYLSRSRGSVSRL